MKRRENRKLPHEHSLPPQNLEAEESLLSAIMIDNSQLPAVREILEPDYFYRSGHQKIFLAILELADQKQPIDLVTLTNHLRERNQLEEIGGATYLSRLIDTAPMAVNVRHYAGIVHEKAMKRFLIQKSNELARKCYEDAMGLDQLLAEEREAFSEIMAKAGKGQKIQKLEMSADDLLNYFSSVRETPFSSLNNLIEGLMVGELTVIGGKSGMGKTALALEFLNYTAINQGRPVIYFGANMSKPRIYARLLAQRCKINLRAIMGSRVPGDKREILLQNHEQINAATIFDHIIKDKISLLELQTKVKKAQDKAKEELGLVIIENLQQLFWPGKSFKQSWDEASFVAEKLKEFCYEIGGIPTIVSSQLTRKKDGSDDNRPTPSEILGKAGEELPDVIIMPYRRNFYEKKEIKEGGRPERNAELLLVKGCPPVILPFTFWGEYLSWEERE